MAIEDLFDHTCDIYHVIKQESSPGYGLPGAPKFIYENTPDNLDVPVPCHFNVKNNNSGNSIIQNAPQNQYEDHIKLTLPIGTDIRLNDKVVNKITGYKYRAEIPKGIRGHHIAVFLQRDGAIEGAL